MHAWVKKQSLAQKVWKERLSFEIFSQWTALVYHLQHWLSSAGELEGVPATKTIRCQTQGDRVGVVTRYFYPAM